jgi:hypothetical protein
MTTHWINQTLMASALTVLMTLPATAQRRRTTAPLPGRPVKSAHLSIEDTRYSIIKVGHGSRPGPVQGWPGQGTMNSPYRIVLPDVSTKDDNGIFWLRKDKTIKAQIQLTLPNEPSDLYGIWMTVRQKPMGASNDVFRNFTSDMSANSVRTHPNGSIRSPLGWVEMDGLVEGLYKLELKGRYRDGSFGLPKNIWILVTNPIIQVRQLYHATNKYDITTAQKLAGRGTARRPFQMTTTQASQKGWLITGGTITDLSNLAIEACVEKETSLDQNFLNPQHFFFDIDNMPTNGNFRHTTRVSHQTSRYAISHCGVVDGAATSLPRGLHKLHVRYYRFREDTGVQTGQTLYLQIAADDGKTNTKTKPSRPGPRPGLRPR